MRTEKDSLEIKRAHERSVYQARFDLLWPAYVKESAHVLPDQELKALEVCIKSALGLVEGMDDETKEVITNIEGRPHTLMKNRVIKFFGYVVHPDTLKGNYASFKRPFVSLGREDLKFSDNLANPGEKGTGDYYAFDKNFYDSYIKQGLDKYLALVLYQC